LINNLKTVSSRLIRRDYRVDLSRIYRNPVFWHRSYCLISSGEATIEILRKYIEEQGSESRLSSPPKPAAVGGIFPARHDNAEAR
jgi:REP element-mobilizing transposase RayT